MKNNFSDVFTFGIDSFSDKGDIYLVKLRITKFPVIDSWDFTPDKQETKDIIAVYFDLKELKSHLEELVDNGSLKCVSIFKGSLSSFDSLVNCDISSILQEHIFSKVGEKNG